MKPSFELLTKLKSISKQLLDLSGDPGQYELDTDALADLSLARDSVDRLVRRVENIRS